LWAGRYTRPGNPLFIPEAQGGAAGAANALYAFGHLAAVGFSVFGIDDQGNAPLDLVGITNPAERSDDGAVTHAYSELTNLSSLVLQKQESGGIHAALLEGEAQRAAREPLGDYTATITRAGSTTGSRVGVMFLQTDVNEFIVVGSGDAQITFSTDDPKLPIAGIESIDEEFFENGAWVPGRRLNGDENSQGQSLRLYATDGALGRIYKLRLYRYR